VIIILPLYNINTNEYHCDYKSWKKGKEQVLIKSEFKVLGGVHVVNSLYYVLLELHLHLIKHLKYS